MRGLPTAFAVRKARPMPLQLFDCRSGSTAPLATAQRGHARVRVVRAATSAALTGARLELMADVLTRHLQAAGARVSSATDAEPCDLELAAAGGERASHGVEAGARRLEVAPVELAPESAELSVSLPAELGSLREPEAQRYLLLGEHYRTPLRLRGDEATPAGLAQLEQAEQQLWYLYATRRRLASIPVERIIDVESKPPPAIGGFAVALATALDADLDTPRALVECERFLRALNELCDHALRKQGKLVRSHLDDAIFGLTSLAGRLGLGDDQPDAWLERVRDRRAAARGLSKAWVESKLRERIAARERKDFAQADALRAELTALGIELVDSAQGSGWSVG